MLWQKMSFCRQNQDAERWEGECKSQCPRMTRNVSEEALCLGDRERAGWWLLLRELVLTPPFFQLERSLLSCTEEWARSMCCSNSWPHTAQELRHQVREMNSLKSLGLCSEKTDGLTSTTRHGKKSEMKQSLFANFSTISDPKLLGSLFCYTTAAFSGSKMERFVMNTHCVCWSEA